MSTGHAALKESHFLLLGTALNMFDTWLPIVSELRDKGLSGAVLFPYEFILARASADDTTLSLAEQLFESVWVVKGNQLHHFSSISAALNQFVRPQFPGTKPGEPVGLLVRKALTLVSQVNLIGNNLQRLRARRIIRDISGKVLLYDATLRTKQNMFHDAVESEAARAGFKIFSISHAPVPLMADEIHSENIPSGWTHVSHLTQGIQNSQSSGTNEVIKCGIPRHDPGWVRQVISRSRKLHGDPKQPYVVLLSHGGGQDYPFSDEAKVQVIEAIGALLKDKGMNLIVKKHPTEQLDPGKDFLLSSAHQLHLLQNAEAMIALITSTVVDGLFMGKPIIQVLGIASGMSHTSAPRTWAEEVGIAIACDSTRDLDQLLGKLSPQNHNSSLRSRVDYSTIFARPDNKYLVSIVEAAIRDGV